MVLKYGAFRIAHQAPRALYHYTASFAALARRALPIFRAGLALNTIASPVKKTARRPIRPSKSCRLTMPEECGVGMRAPWDEAGQLQRPLLQTMLKIVASGEREEPHSQAAQSQPSLSLWWTGSNLF
jgi:hypothetical protein